MGQPQKLIEHTGGCHCGRVRYKVISPEDITVSQCNCSICSKSGYLGLIVRAEHFTLLKGQDCLTTYVFNTGVAKHLFCSYCGIKSYYVPRSHPDGYNVNARCLDPGTVKNMTIRPVDGLNWERLYPKGRADGFPNDEDI